MFGYIAPRLEQLDDKQRKRYRAVYCGLCQTLGELSGRSGRLLLSHDMTFLALLLSSLNEPAEAEKRIRCAVHPVRERQIVQSKAVAYAAEMNLILMDLKCEDQIRDDRSRIAQAEKARLAPAMAKISEARPAQCREAREALEALWAEEKQPRPDPDRLGNLSGAMLGAVFVPEWTDPYWNKPLRELGEGLGRFVYWMDAWDDRKQDRRRRRFNPIECLTDPDIPEESFRQMLEMLIGEATERFEALPLEKDLELRRNVLYSGVWQKFDLHRGRRDERVKKA